MGILARESPATGRVYIWEELAGEVTAFVMPPGSFDDQDAFEAALKKPALDLVAVGGDPEIVEVELEIQPGGPDHARAVMRALGATKIIVDDAGE